MVFPEKPKNEKPFQQFYQELIESVNYHHPDRFSRLTRSECACQCHNI